VVDLGSERIVPLPRQLSRRGAPPGRGLSVRWAGRLWQSGLRVSPPSAGCIRIWSCQRMSWACFATPCRCPVHAGDAKPRTGATKPRLCRTSPGRSP